MLLHPPASLCEVEAAHVLVVGEQAGQRASHLAHLYAQWHVKIRTLENANGIHIGADNQGRE